MAEVASSSLASTFAALQKNEPACGADNGLGDSVLGRLFGALSDSLLKCTQEACPESTQTPFGYGVKSVVGQRPAMEDSYAVQEKLASPAAIGGGAPEAVSTREGTPSPSKEREVWVPFLPSDLAFFSVFDGHGGDAVALHCSTRLHRLFASELCLSRMHSSPLPGSSSGADGEPSTPDRASRSASAGSAPRHLSTSGRALSDSPEVLDSLVNSSLHSSLQPLSSEMVCAALKAAFSKTDEELAGTEDGEFVGATAVVAVVGKERIWVAHCGDSRAVIQRGGSAEALTRDHKPDREDEAARIKAAGGRIVYNSGSHRVMGMLAMSRAIGDHFLRPYVIADPEVSCVPRTVHDEVLIIATDGLWDVFSCKEATTLASRCIVRSKERGMSRHGACRVAASVLTKVALERGSRDNITVIVIDISLPTEEELAQGADGATGVPSSAQPAEPASGAPEAARSKSSSLGHVFWLKSQVQPAAAPKSYTAGMPPPVSAPALEDSSASAKRPSLDRISSAPHARMAEVAAALRQSAAGGMGAIHEGEDDAAAEGAGCRGQVDQDLSAEDSDVGRRTTEEVDDDEDVSLSSSTGDAASEGATSAGCHSVRSGSSIASLATATASLALEGEPSAAPVACARPSPATNTSHQPIPASPLTAPPAQGVVACGQDQVQAPIRVLALGSDGGSSTASVAGSAAAMASAHHEG